MDNKSVIAALKQANAEKDAIIQRLVADVVILEDKLRRGKNGNMAMDTDNILPTGSGSSNS